MKQRFKIMYPEDYFDPTKAGKPYLPPEHHMVVMNGGGVFFLYCDSIWGGIQRLSDVLFKYDVIWK